MKEIFVLTLMLLMSRWDFREKTVPIQFLFAGSSLAGLWVSYKLLTGQMLWPEVFLGALPGIFLVAVAWLSKKAGYADGIVLIWLGILYGYRRSLAFLGISLFLICVLSITLLMLRRVKRYSRIPYIPFLTIAFLFVNLCGL